MSRDPIVEEIRAIRERLAAKFGFDVDAILKDAQERDAAEGVPVVRLKGRTKTGQARAARASNLP